MSKEMPLVFGERKRSNYIFFMKTAIDIKGINRVKKKLKTTGDEVIYYYAWKGGPRILAPFGTPEFVAEYQDKFKRKIDKPKNLSGILDAYARSTRFNKNKPVTIERNLISVKQIKEKLGELPASVFDDPDIIDVLEDWRDKKVAVEKSPGVAEHQFSTLSGALTWAKERNIIKRNPCDGHHVSMAGSRVDKIWSDQQIEQYIELAPSTMIIALMLGLWTGQREGSLIMLRWSAYDGNILTVVQEKNLNGTPAKIVKVPVRGEFKKFMDDLQQQAGVVGLSKEERDERYIILNARGRPWKKKSFCTNFGRVTKTVVKIEDRTFHDLRGTAITRLFIAGCDVPEIATLTGHSLKTVQAILDKHYFHRDIKLAERAMDKRLAHEGDVLSTQLTLVAEKMKAKAAA